MAEENVSSYIEETEKPIDYKRYFFLVRKHFYILLTFLIIAITLASIYASKIPDQYTTSVQLIVERPKVPLGDNSTAMVEDAESLKDDYYTTQIEIIRSMGVIRQAVEELKLTSYYGMDSVDDVAARVRGMISVKRLTGSRLINIYVKSNQPELAANLANAMGRAYIRTNFENRLYYTKEILGWLPENEGGSEVVTVKDPLGGVKQITREQLIETLPAIQADPTLQQLRSQKNQLESDLKFNLERYREKHPVIIKQRANLDFLTKNIEAEKSRILERLKTEAEGRYQLGQARIIEEAPVPKAPIKSERMKVILGVSIGELIISLLIIFLLDFFDDTIRAVEDFERKGLVLPFLGPVALIKGKKNNREETNLITFHDKKSDIAEAFRYLRVAINFSATPDLLKKLVISSCLPHEGKSFVAHNLAVSLALDGNKTLLIDGDLRRPVLQEVFRVDNSTGLSNFLTSNIKLSDVTKETFVENLSVISSGPMSPNPGEILGSKKMKELLDEAGKRYDQVIIDSPPLTALGDGFVLGSLVGHIILVIASAKTPTELIKRINIQLDKAQIKILGTILNMVDMEKERHSGYYKYYYHTYNRYYPQADQAAS